MQFVILILRQPYTLFHYHKFSNYNTVFTSPTVIVPAFLRLVLYLQSHALAFRHYTISLPNVCRTLCLIHSPCNYSLHFPSFPFSTNIDSFATFFASGLSQRPASSKPHYHVLACQTTSSSFLHPLPLHLVPSNPHSNFPMSKYRSSIPLSS